MAAPGVIRVVLVEDQPVARAGMRAVIGAEPDLAVVGEARTLPDALALAGGADVVVQELLLGGRPRGAQLCATIKALPTPPAVLVYTASTSMGDVAASYLSGADGFVHKRAEPESLLEGIRGTHAGRRVWRAGQSDDGAVAALARTLAAAGLTGRERQVLTLMLQRLGNAEIADELYLGLPTVKTHVRHVLRKFGVTRREDLAAVLGGRPPVGAPTGGR
jgi:NarL family two-component system response regulator LiaR